MFKTIIKPTLTLTIIAAVISGLLAITYNLTGVGNISDAIPQSELAEYTSSILPEADSLKEAKVKVDNEAFLGAYTAKNGKGSAINVSVKGYNKQEPLKLLVGFDKAGTITGIVCTSNSETPGLGAKVSDESFSKQFVGTNKKIALKKDGGSIDAISGATISSRAYAEGVNTALDIYSQIKGDL